MMPVTNNAGIKVSCNVYKMCSSFRQILPEVVSLLFPLPSVGALLIGWPVVSAIVSGTISAGLITIGGLVNYLTTAYICLGITKITSSISYR
jgi:hypothetical protein